MDAPRVLVCTQGFPRHPDDHHAVFVLDHARALAAAGVAVRVLCPSGPGLPQNDRFGDVDVVRFRYAPSALERLAYTGAILSMIPCVSGCCLLGLPFGIWAVMTLNKPEVKAGFAAAAGRPAGELE